MRAGRARSPGAPPRGLQFELTGNGARWLIALSLPLIAWLDWLTTSELSLSFVYLGPILLAVWTQPRFVSVATEIAAVSLCFFVDYLDHVHPNHPIFVIGNAITRLVFFVVAAAVTWRLRHAYEQLAQAGRTDALTGLLNRRGFDDVAERERCIAQRTGRPVTLAMIDLDKFKSVNDTRGHAEGDAVLRLVARCLSSVRAADVVARLGGDEFCILLPETDDRAAQVLLQRLQTDTELSLQTQGWPVTLSIGSTTFETPMPRDVETMLAQADLKMYHHKHSKHPKPR